MPVVVRTIYCRKWQTYHIKGFPGFHTYSAFQENWMNIEELCNVQ